MGKMWKDIGKKLLVLIAGGCAGFVMLLLVYAIPIEPILFNARASVEIFQREGVMPQAVEGYRATTMDNYTDSWMLRIAFYDGDDSLLQKSLNNYYYGYGEEQTRNVCESMIAYLDGMEGYTRMSYGRYWHGYLVFLKPLLCFFSYGDIRGILKGVELALIIWLCVLLERRHLGRFAPAFAVAMGCIEFHTVAMSMQYSWVFIIAMAFSVYILQRYPDQKEKLESGVLFLMIGMCTSFLDFLTYPVFTLGIPLMILLLCRNESKEEKGFLKSAVYQAGCWAVGYIGMWVQKWVLCSIFTGENMIADALRTIRQRSGTDVMGTAVGYGDVLFENIRVLCKWPYVLAVAAVCILALVRVIRGIIRNRDAKTQSDMAQTVRGNAERFAAYLFVALLPFMWYAISINHSYIHAVMTYKDLGIAIFACACMVTEAAELCVKR